MGTQIIKAKDIIDSVADALQYISYYHPVDFIRAMHRAYRREKSPSAKNAMAQILINSRMAALGKRPLCQDTGIVVVFIKMGNQVKLSADMSLQEMIDAGVRRAYTDADNPLRSSIVDPPFGKRKNTGDNTPAVVHQEIVPGNVLSITVAAKGGGSENKSKFAILNPGDDVASWVLHTIPSMGAGWCPPGVLGIGIGGTAEKAMLLAKESLMESVNIDQIREAGPRNSIEALRLELMDSINRLGIGAQGLGGLTTVLDVKIKQYPTHAASLPVAIIPNCAASRHVHFTLNGSGVAEFKPPDLDDWPEIPMDHAKVDHRVNLEHLNKDLVSRWRVGETVLLSGKILTGRDAAHKRLCASLAEGGEVPDGIDFSNRLIYYVGPVNATGDEVVGPAGPTTATRMDSFTDIMLSKTRLCGMIGKAERGDEAIESIKKHGAVYLIAIGGAAYLVSKAIRSARVVAYNDLGMEAIYEFTVENMPVTVAVDSRGESIHKVGPAYWRQAIVKMDGLLI